MASGMTKTQLIRHLAEKTELNNKTAALFLEQLADTAIKETKKNGVFVVPGLGRLVNRMMPTDHCEPWTFGVAALMRSLARRGVLHG